MAASTEPKRVMSTRRGHRGLLKQGVDFADTDGSSLFAGIIRMVCNIFDTKFQMKDSKQRSISNEELSFLHGLCAERTRSNGLMLTCLSGTCGSTSSGRSTFLPHSSPGTCNSAFVPGALGLASCSRRRGSLSQGPGQLGCLKGRLKKYCARVERDPLGCTEGTTHRLGYSRSWT